MYIKFTFNHNQNICTFNVSVSVRDLRQKKLVHLVVFHQIKIVNSIKFRHIAYLYFELLLQQAKRVLLNFQST